MFLFKNGQVMKQIYILVICQFTYNMVSACSNNLITMKAFDCIQNDLLLAELKAYGKEEVSLTLIASYFRNRKQRVKICGYCSEWMPLRKGVPQGSISRPSIVNFFINHFCLLFEELLAHYTNDSHLIVIQDEVQEVKAMLENETVKPLKWFEENHMKANPDKFQCILHSKTPDPEFCISLGDTVIEPSDTVDLLRIVIDDKLTLHQHVKKMTSNAALKLNAL